MIYAAASTVPGTGLFCQCSEFDLTELLEFNCVSDDSTFCERHNLLCGTPSFNAVDVPFMTYECCVYNSINWTCSRNLFTEK